MNVTKEVDEAVRRREKREQSVRKGGREEKKKGGGERGRLKCERRASDDGVIRVGSP